MCICVHKYTHKNKKYIGTTFSIMVAFILGTFVFLIVYKTFTSVIRKENGVIF